MARFEEDKHREAVLGEFLESHLYPRIATEFDRVAATEKQKAGHDAVITFEWMAEPVVVDEKAQNSDKWLNDPSPTFVMEIFGESWVTNGTPEGNIGWFVDEDNETEYYLLVWLPDVSIFKLVEGIDTAPYLVYQPSESVDFAPSDVAAHAQSEVRHTMDSSTGTYRLERTSDAVDAFEATVEAVPDVIRSGGDADYGEWYYDPRHIYEAKVAIVQKETIRETLAEDGLTRDTLLEKGRRAIEEGTVDVDSEKAKYVLRSSGTQSGSADGEDPVVLVVTYDTYDSIADRTFHYADGTWSEDVQLF